MVATLTRIFGLQHLALAEDVVQEAFVAALRTWPFQGMPENPTGWIVQVAKNRALDALRRQGLWQERSRHVLHGLEPLAKAGDEARFSAELRDDALRMIFACCHPAIPREAQVALTLKTVGGFSVPEIARAFLAQEPTIAQRLVRAKRALRERGVELSIPPPNELPERLPPVLDVLYLLFNEGYSALEGEALVRHDLCEQAIHLVELVAAHPQITGPTVHALAALFLLQAARSPARADGAGDLLLLPEQDRTRFDPAFIRRGLDHLEAAATGGELSPYHLEAEIAACHSTAPSDLATDWPRILHCYDLLLTLNPSPVVALNRAVALAKVEGPAAGLAAVAPLLAEASCALYAPLHATHGLLLAELGRTNDAAAALATALGLTSSGPVQRFLVKKRQALAAEGTAAR